MKGFHCCIIVIGLLLGSLTAQADDATVAVANNFYGPVQALVADFSQVAGFQLSVSTGSTGQLYAQIINGAPFDFFFAADTKRPMKLVDEGMGFNLFIYAKGQLVLWSKALDYDVKQHLTLGDFNHFAIADPKLAPYGVAAEQVLTSMGLWESMAPQIVMGKGLNTTYQFLATGNTELGMVAKSQVFKNGQYVGGSYWAVPITDYEPIEQGAVTLKSGLENKAIQAFLDYYSTKRAQNIVASFGYVQ